MEALKRFKDQVSSIILRMYLSVTVFYTVTTPRVGPVDGVFGADDAAGAALKTVFIVEYQRVSFFVPLIVLRWTDGQTGAGGAGFAKFLFYGDMGFFVDLEFYGFQFFFN